MLISDPSNARPTITAVFGDLVMMPLVAWFVPVAILLVGVSLALAVRLVLEIAKRLF